MAYVSTFRVEVRSYELDVYDHVNNAVYINWLEHGRSKFLQDKGFNYISIVDQWGVRFMTVRTEIDYRKALRLGDRAEITTTVERFGNTSVTFRQVITRAGDDAPAAEARVVIVYTEKDSGRPVPVPDHFKRLCA
ncbi:MAG: acyl-CoA thioesterase [Planctomycetes bacterium]|nr:acyl-CoA thioesterase [Planctomycetota bacterium]MCW8134113.1 acyl-CoA thioesterase [Planctomycetota bacterium]